MVRPLLDTLDPVCMDVVLAVFMQPPPPRQRRVWDQDCARLLNLQRHLAPQFQTTCQVRPRHLKGMRINQLPVDIQNLLRQVPNDPGRMSV